MPLRQEERDQLLAALYEISRLTAGPQPDLDGMLHRVLHVAAQLDLLGASERTFAVRSYLALDDELHLRAGAGAQAGDHAATCNSVGLELARLAYSRDENILAHAGDAVGGHYAQKLALAGFGMAMATPFDQNGVRGASVLFSNALDLRNYEVQRYALAGLGYVTSAIATTHLVQTLERAVSDYKALARFGHQIEKITEPDELVRHGIASLHAQLGITYVAFADVEGRLAVPRIRHRRAEDDGRGVLELPFPLDVGVVGQAVREQRPVLVNDYEFFEPKPPLIDRLNLVSVLAVPVHVQGAVRHVLIMANDARDGRIDGTDVAVVELFAQRIANALERVQHIEEVSATREATFRSLGRALEYRDLETHGHTDRVTALMTRFAERLGAEPEEVTGLVWGAYLHDLGKLSVPDSVLLKPGRLTEAEFEVVKLHSVHGAEMVRDIPFLPDAAHAIVRHHHERWDGQGYPDGLAGEDIPLPARLFALVDVYDALTSNRVYREAWTHERAVEEIRSLAGQHFDPHLVEEFVSMVTEWLRDCEDARE